jgi:hypothetical protein
MRQARMERMQQVVNDHGQTEFQTFLKGFRVIDFNLSWVCTRSCVPAAIQWQSVRLSVEVLSVVRKATANLHAAQNDCIIEHCCCCHAYKYTTNLVLDGHAMECPSAVEGFKESPHAPTLPCDCLKALYMHAGGNT